MITLKCGLRATTLFQTENAAGYRITVPATGDIEHDLQLLRNGTNDCIELMPGHTCEIFEMAGDPLNRLLIFEKVTAGQLIF